MFGTQLKLHKALPLPSASHSSASIPTTSAPIAPTRSTPFILGASALFVGIVPNVEVLKTTVVLAGGTESGVPADVVVGRLLVVVVGIDDEEEDADEGVELVTVEVVDVIEVGGPRVVIGGEGVGLVVVVVVEVEEDDVVTELHMLVSTPPAEL